MFVVSAEKYFQFFLDKFVVLKSLASLVSFFSVSYKPIFVAFFKLISFEISSCVPKDLCKKENVQERETKLEKVLNLRFALAEESSCEKTTDHICCHKDSIKKEENLCEKHIGIGYG